MADDAQTPPGNPLGAAGECPAFEWNGKTYRVGHPTQAARVRYCNALVESERAGIDEQLAAGWITPAEKSAKYDALGKRRQRREHMPGGPLWLEYSAGPEFVVGLRLFVWSLLRETDDTVTPAEVGAMFDGCPDLLKLAIREVIPNFLSWVAEAMKVPLATLTEALAPYLERAEALLTKLGG